MADDATWKRLEELRAKSLRQGGDSLVQLRKAEEAALAILDSKKSRKKPVNREARFKISLGRSLPRDDMTKLANQFRHAVLRRQLKHVHHQYSALLSATLTAPYVCATALLQIMGPADTETVACLLADIFEARGSAAAFIAHLVSLEIENTISANTLFRINSPSTKVMKGYSMKLGGAFLEASIGRHLNVVPCWDDPNFTVPDLNPLDAAKSKTFYLHCKEGPLKGEEFTLSADAKLTIGRSSTRGNVIVLADESVSKNHAVIYFNDDTRTYHIRNLSNTNQVFVRTPPDADGQRVVWSLHYENEKPLHSGCVIRIGQLTKFVFSDSSQKAGKDDTSGSKPPSKSVSAADNAAPTAFRRKNSLNGHRKMGNDVDEALRAGLPDKAVPEDDERIIKLAQMFLDAVLRAEELWPPQFREMCIQMRNIVGNKFPEAPLTAVVGFVFLRFVCPAIVSPSSFAVGGQEGVKIEKDHRNVLVSVAKLLQTLANRATVPTGMIRGNPAAPDSPQKDDFLQYNLPRIRAFVARVSSPQASKSPPPPPPDDQSNSDESEESSNLSENDDNSDGGDISDEEQGISAAEYRNLFFFYAKHDATIVERIQQMSLPDEPVHVPVTNTAGGALFAEDEAHRPTVSGSQANGIRPNPCNLMPIPSVLRAMEQFKTIMNGLKQPDPEVVASLRAAIAAAFQGRLLTVTTTDGMVTRTLANCFSGREMIDWLTNEHLAPAAKLEDALAIAQRLVANELVQNVQNLQSREFGPKHMDNVYRITADSSLPDSTASRAVTAQVSANLFEDVEHLFQLAASTVEVTVGQSLSRDIEKRRSGPPQAQPPSPSGGASPPGNGISGVSTVATPYHGRRMSVATITPAPPVKRDGPLSVEDMMRDSSIFAKWATEYCATSAGVVGSANAAAAATAAGGEPSFVLQGNNLDFFLNVYALAVAAHRKHGGS